MMKFHFEFDIKKPMQLIAHHHSMMMVGSCFTDNISKLLTSFKFNVLENPNGILFNPISVAEAIEMYINRTQMDATQLFCLNECWHSWKYHSKFSGITIADALKKMNRSTDIANSYLKNANFLFITLGSAWIYELTNHAEGYTSGMVAANNHKAPSNWFNKRLLTADETNLALTKMINQLLAFNPHIQIIFTISPVRHLREGVIENNRSKAVLIQAVHDVVNANEQLNYFPSYELVIDDLRDYRFFAEDLVHPNYLATQYVWEKFSEVWMSLETRELIKAIKEINLAYQHKPFNPNTAAHIEFLNKYAQITKHLMEMNPKLDFSKELDYFRMRTK